jgi:hypothetical protein
VNGKKKRSANVSKAEAAGRRREEEVDEPLIPNLYATADDWSSVAAQVHAETIPYSPDHTQSRVSQ